ncbi:MAG: DUF3786 domain-containing protein [Eubacteriaceae bacterium]|nr:DUF3786 domain-containing protein [Eubacteriaceae bacterium]
MADNTQGRVPYEFALERFQKLDIHEIVDRLGLPPTDEGSRILVNLMGKDYVVSCPDGRVYDSRMNEVSSYILRILILRYLVNGKGSQLTGRNITFKEISNGQIYYPNFNRRTIKKLADTFDGNEEIYTGAQNLPGFLKIKSGDFSISFDFMKNVQITFICWHGDEELPPSANILFDANIEDYFDAEDLAVVGDVAISYFLKGGQIPEDLGMYDI